MTRWRPHKFRPVEAGSGPWKVLCLGGASCVREDVARLEEIEGGPWDGVIVAANDIGVEWDRVDHWVTCHADQIPAWTRARKAAGRECGAKTWGQGKGHLDVRVEPWRQTSSGGLAVRVALEGLGASRVVMCGIPLTVTPHFHIEKPWLSADKHWEAFRRAEEFMQGSVKSMSGRTRELLGEPTVEWLTRR